MTIDEAISHALEVAGEQQERADSAELIDILDGLDVESCKECAADHRQLAKWLTELKEAKRLLKSAVEALNDGSCNKDCRQCENHKSCDYGNPFKWKYTNEVLKLIGEDSDAE